MCVCLAASCPPFGKTHCELKLELRIACGELLAGNIGCGRGAVHFEFITRTRGDSATHDVACCSGRKHLILPPCKHKGRRGRRSNSQRLTFERDCACVYVCASHTLSLCLVHFLVHRTLCRAGERREPCAWQALVLRPARHRSGVVHTPLQWTRRSRVPLTRYSAVAACTKRERRGRGGKGMRESVIV